MKGRENFKLARAVSRKEYFVPEEDHEVWNHFNTALAACTNSADLQTARFEIIMVYPKISKTCVARVCKGNARDKLFAGFDFVIEVSGDYWDSISESVKDILMEHELEHCDVRYSKEGNISFRTRDHIIKDFPSIIDKHGVNWFITLSDIVNDLNDADDINVSI